MATYYIMRPDDHSGKCKITGIEHLMIKEIREAVINALKSQTHLDGLSDANRTRFIELELLRAHDCGVLDIIYTMSCEMDGAGIPELLEAIGRMQSGGSGFPITEEQIKILYPA